MEVINLKPAVAGSVVFDEKVAASWQTMEIPVHVHVIRGDEATRVEKEHVDLQLEVMNRAFAGGRIAFTERSLEFINTNEWLRMGLGSDAEQQHKLAFGKEIKSSLNLYVSNLQGTGARGYARQPWEFVHLQNLDGIVVHYESLPGFPRKSKWGEVNKGSVAVHEVGHWFGLHHVFEGYGTSPGDAVEDTPLRQVPSRARVHKDADLSQPFPHPKPCANYMDRSSDDCRNFFTPGQFFRIREVVLPKYKNWLLP